MSNKQNRSIASVNRYANALFQLAKEAKVLDSVAVDLSNLQNIINSDDKIFLFIKNPAIKKSVKMIFFNALSKKIELSKLSINFIGVIIKKNRIHYLLDMIHSFNNLLSSLRGEKLATISSAEKLTDTEIDSIKNKLKEKFNSEFNVDLIIDSELIGGLKIQVGSQMIDSSIKNQLNLLKAKMKEVA